MGDKTQLLALSFATRFKPSHVLWGVLIGTLVVHLLSVVIGVTLTGFIPFIYLKWLIGLSFIGFGLWTLKGDSYDEKRNEKNFWGPIGTVAMAFALAELGDKTQLSTISLSAQYRSFVGVWLGSSLGMVLADSLAIGIGIVAGKKIPEKALKIISSLIFIVFGLFILLQIYLTKH